MNEACQDFIKAVVNLSPAVRATVLDTRRYWAPDEPPLTILFGEIGARIADDFDSSEVGNARQIFALIESAMASNNEQLITAVATGLIEGLVSRVDLQTEKWQRIRQAFGTLSRRHAEAWLGQ